VGDNVTTEQGEAETASFMGRFLHALDGKKRLTIPSTWRALAGTPAELVAVPSVSNNPHERCIWIYPLRVWNQRVASLRKVSSADEKVRRALSVLASRSEMLTWDAAGRLRVNDELLKHASLTGQVLLVGALERFELWEPEQWKQLEETVDSTVMMSAFQSTGL
jgi:MraZ protein